MSDGISYVAEGTHNGLGISYKDGIIFDASLNAYEIYELDGKFAKFSGTALVDERASGGKSIALEIYLDGILGYSKYEITNGDLFDFEIDLTGVSQMKIVTYNEGSFSSGLLVFINTNFEKI